MAPEGSTLRERVAYAVAGDPRFRVVVPGHGLLCPWCLKVAFPIVAGKQLVEAVARHIEHDCTVARGDPDAPMMAAISIQEMAKFLFLKEECRTSPAYRVFGPDGSWICPYCGELPDIRAIAPDGKRIPPDQLVQAVKRHFDKCFQYQDHPTRHYSAEELKNRISLIRRQKEFRTGIVALMKTNPVMQFYDTDGHWVCPFCRKPVDYVDMTTAESRERTAPVHAAKHLSSECPVARKTLKITVTQEEMEAVVKRINAEKSVSVAPPAPAREGRPDDTTYIKALSVEVLALREEVKRNEDLARSLERAQSVQQRMLPSQLPEVPGYEFRAVFQACESVSGDFYDIFRLAALQEFDPEGYQEIDVGGDRLGILIGDVSGHGLEAALVMGMAKKAFNVRAQENVSAAEVTRKVNADVFPDIEEGTFITAAFSILDPARHRIDFTRAGHNPAILLRAADKEITQVTPAGMILGVDRGPRFDKALAQEVISIEPGDVFVQYTDGVTEGMNPSDEEFGVGRLAEAVVRAAGRPAETVADEVVSALEHFMGPRAQEDDITLVVVRRLPEDSGSQLPPSSPAPRG